MEERLSQFLEENSRLSGASIMEGCNVSMPGAYGSCVHPANSSSVNSSQLSSSQLSIDQATSRLISDGATRFIHHQIVEIASGNFDHYYSVFNNSPLIVFCILHL